MNSIAVAVLLVPLLFDFCTAQCLIYPWTSSPPGSKVSGDDRCHLHGLDLEPGSVHTNMTSCMKCHCGFDLTLYCCSLLFTYTVPDDCVVVTKDCTQKAVYKSDGSPCQAIAAISRK